MFAFVYFVMCNLNFTLRVITLVPSSFLPRVEPQLSQNKKNLNIRRILGRRRGQPHILGKNLTLCMRLYKHVQRQISIKKQTMKTCFFLYGRFRSDKLLKYSSVLYDISLEIHEVR